MKTLFLTLGISFMFLTVDAQLNLTISQYQEVIDIKLKKKFDKRLQTDVYYGQSKDNVTEYYIPVVRRGSKRIWYIRECYHYSVNPSLAYFKDEFFGPMKKSDGLAAYMYVNSADIHLFAPTFDAYFDYVRIFEHTGCANGYDFCLYTESYGVQGLDPIFR